MDIKFNIPDWIKIPLNILLPALCLFSGFSLLLPDEFLARLYLINWRNENGFILGLIFLISSCLLLVYVIRFLLLRIKKLVYKKLRHRKVLLRFGELNDVEQSLIAQVYNARSYTLQVDGNQPIVQSLIEKRFLYAGLDQSFSSYSPAIRPILVTLPTHIIDALDYARNAMEQELLKCSKALKRLHGKKKAKVQKKYDELQIQYSYFERTLGGNK